MSMYINYIKWQQYFDLLCLNLYNCEYQELAALNQQQFNTLIIINYKYK